MSLFDFQTYQWAKGQRNWHLPYNNALEALKNFLGDKGSHNSLGDGIAANETEISDARDGEATMLAKNQSQDALFNIEHNPDGTHPASASAGSDWKVSGHSVFYVSANSFSIPLDVAAIYVKGRRLKLTLGSGDVFGSIVSAVYSAPDTTITIQELNLDNTLSAVSYGLISPGETGSMPKIPEIDVLTSNQMRAFEEIQENHGGSLLMEAGWSDSFGNANDQGADDAISTGIVHDPINTLYKGADPGIGIDINKDYDTESNFIQQEWTNSTGTGTSQANVASGTTVTLSLGIWPTHCHGGRISFDSGSSWFVIVSRESDTEIKLMTPAPDGDFNYIIRITEFDAGKIRLTEIPSQAIDSNTVLLLKMDGNFSDSSQYSHSVTAHNNVYLDSSQTKLGSTSARFNGDNAHLSIPDSSLFTMGAGDCTFECYIRMNSIGGDVMGCHMTDGNYYHSFSYSASSLSLSFGTPGMATIQAPWSPSTNTWYHVAIVRSGSNGYVFVDGQQIGTTTTVTGTMQNHSSTYTIGIIGQHYLSNEIDAWMESYRISNVARWTSNFTPPAVHYGLKQNTTLEYVSACDKEAQKTDTSPWSDINSGSVTETLDSQNIYYWLAFDPVDSFGDGTEIKIFNSAGSIWRKIVRKNGNNWEFNNDATDTAAESWTVASTNDLLYAVSQAVSTQTGNRMTGANLVAITDTQWEESGGWSISINSIVRGITLFSNNNGQNPSVSQYRLNYDSERGGMDLRSKAYDPGFVPSEAYVWTRAEHADIDGPGTFQVSRNGGAEWTAVSMVQQGLPLEGDNRILRGTVDLGEQTIGQDLRCRYQTTQGKDQFLHSWGLQVKP